MPVRIVDPAGTKIYDSLVASQALGNATDIIANLNQIAISPDQKWLAGMLNFSDVLVVPFTGPSVNSFLPVIGALVVEEGGALCHSAIVAREFGLAAVIGAHRATSRIPHGAQVEVDPVHGTVRLL